MMMTGAQILVEALKREGVEHIFGYAGATICPIADVLRETAVPGIHLGTDRARTRAIWLPAIPGDGKTGVCLVRPAPGPPIW